MERAKDYVRSFLETAEVPERYTAWLKLANLCSRSDDPLGEIHALSEAALVPTSGREELSMIANRFNTRLRDLKGQNIEDAWSGEVRELLGRVIEAMERHRTDLSAIDCSRLAWLHLNVGTPERALDVARIGLEREPTNEYCQRLILKLNPS